MNLLRRIFSLFRRAQLDREMAEEMAAHLERETEQNLARGLPPDEAHYAARRAFGGLDQFQERERDARGWRWIEDLIRDLRHALRSLRKSPGFTAVAVLSLALGIGANTAVFSLVNAILLASLPVPNPQDLRVLQWSGVGAKTGNFTGSMQTVGSLPRSTGGMSYAGHTGAGRRTIADAFTFPQYRLLREQVASLADIFGYANLSGITVRARQEPFTAEGLMVSDNFFSGLGVRPLLGRVFGSEEAGAGAAPSVVICHEWWERQFGLDPAVLGASVALNGHAFTIVGVLPPGFPGVHPSDRAEFYVPMSAQPQLLPGWPPTSSDHWWIKLLARIRPDAGAAQLQAALDVVFSRETQAVMKEPAVVVLDGRAGPGWDREHYRQPLLLLLGVVGVVILVACANLAGLSLARSAARQHEFSVRVALGSGRWRLIRQSLTESLLLAVLGGVLGLLLAFWAKTAISRLLAGSPEGLRYDLALDGTVLGFTLALTLVTALLAGLLPAWRAGQADPVAGLKSRAAVSAPRLRAGRILVAAQITLSVLLLAGAGLYVRTLVNLVRINPGFATERLLLFQLNPRAAGLRGAAATAFFERALDAAEKIPGARAVALTQFKLLAGSMSGGSFFTLPAHPELTDEKRPAAHRLNVSETFFSTLGIPLVLGRGFTAADAEGAPKVVVVNQTFVRSYFPDQIPVGQILKIGKDDWQIAGVCGDAKDADLRADVPPTVYFSYRQSGIGSAYLAVRTAQSPFALVAAARKAIAAIDPNVPLADATTQAAVRDQRISQERMFATLVGALAGLAVLLACIGLYGLMAYNVARRTGEIGVRLALGATPGRVARPVLREALVLAVVGIAIGLPAAAALATIVKHQLYGVAPFDPATLAGAAILLLAVAVFAAWVPARKASHVDPIEALRAE
jgi:predicted permease